jgi:hypothetical protein
MRTPVQYPFRGEIGSAAEDYFESLKARGISEKKTLQSYKRIISNFVEYLLENGVGPISGIMEDCIVKFMESRQYRQKEYIYKNDTAFPELSLQLMHYCYHYCCTVITDFVVFLISCYSHRFQRLVPCTYPIRKSIRPRNNHHRLRYRLWQPALRKCNCLAVC